MSADGKASTSAPGLAHVAYSHQVSGGTRGGSSCLEATPKLPPKSGFKRESAVADHYKQVEAMLASSSSVVAKLSTLAIDPTFLVGFTPAWAHGTATLGTRTCVRYRPPYSSTFARALLGTLRTSVVFRLETSIS